jgi:alpha-N-arabinofuranosidase
LDRIQGGDDRFYNNIFIGQGGSATSTRNTAGKEQLQATGFGLWVYDGRQRPLQTGGNTYYNGARPYTNERNHVALPGIDPKVRVVEEAGQVALHFETGPEMKQGTTALVTTALLGKARIPSLPYENGDGSSVRIDGDYFGKKRNEASPSPGPFEALGAGSFALKVW